MQRLTRWTRAGLVLALGVASVPLWADDPISRESYIQPPSPLKELVHAPWHENESYTNLGPDGRTFLMTLGGGAPPLASLARPYVRLGGFAVDLRANRARGLSTGTTQGFVLVDIESRQRRTIQAPRGAHVSGVRWSPDGRHIAYFAHFDEATHIMVAEVANGRTRQLTRTPVLATHVTSFDWTGDSQQIVTVLLPNNRPPMPRASEVPSEPLVRHTTDSRNRLRTFPSLLANPHEMALYEWAITGQLAAIDLSGRVTTIGEPAMIRGFDVGPNAKFVRVTTVRKPFSYIVPVSSFGSQENLWNANGQSVYEFSRRGLQLGTQADPPEEEPFIDHDNWRDYDENWRRYDDPFFHELQDNPLSQGRGGGGGQPAGGGQAAANRRRNFAWRPDGRGMTFLQLEPARQGQTTRKDRVMRWFEPYGENDVEVVYEQENAISSVSFGSDGKTIFISESRDGTNFVYAVSLDNPSQKHLVSQNRTANFYETPGTLETTRGPFGVNVVQMSADGRYVYLTGTQYYRDPMENAPRPFVDRVAWAQGTASEAAPAERLWQSSEDHFERIGAWLDGEFNRYVLLRESRFTPADSFLVRGGQEERLTNNRDFNGAATMLRRDRFQVTRPDGFQFWVDVTLPSDYDPNNPPPAFFWFYPREYPTQAAYNNTTRTYNKNSFRTITRTNKQMLALMGYTVVEPDCPIVGPTDRRNESYMQDLRSNMYAVINELDRRKYADRDRLALGGHSYGGFGTANAMIATPFFRAGIAGAGNYNRLLTPAGFQSEPRLLWEAREVYTTMSPLLWAEQIHGALLLYHGQEDQNVGTWPINSDRLFHALNILGKTASLYVYPYEDHGQTARESVYDLWARWLAWLDKHVKGIEPRS